MNQTQTRSLRKKVLSLILAVVMAVSLLPISAFASGNSTSTTDTTSDEYEYNIMFLDCGRKYYSVDSIKQIIDNASAAGFNYIQLAVGNDGLRFLLDDMSLTVNGTTYGSDAVKEAIQTGNTTYNASKSYKSDKNELSESEMDAIIAYAASKGMGVIPCVNTPGHMDAILSAASSLTGTNCSYSSSARTIDVTNTTAVAFTQALLQKYITYFAGKNCKLFNMGADEYANDKFTGGSMGFGNLQSTGKYRYYVQYVNQLAAKIKAAGMTPMAFNDGIYFNNNTSSGEFDTDIVICYWSSGWSGYTPMSASDLAGKGFKLINTNGSYYWILGGNQCDAKTASNFDKTAFPGKDNTDTINNPAGSMFCIWADYPGAETEASVISKTADTIAAFGKALPQIGIKSSGGTALTLNGSTELTVPGNAEATWSVDPAGVIELQASGNADERSAITGTSVVAKAVGAGTAKVTATVDDKTTYTTTLTVTDPSTVDVTVAVNGTKTITVDGYYNGSYATEDTTIATASAVGTAAVDRTENEVTTIESGKQYLIVHKNSGLVLNDSTSGNGILLGEKANSSDQLWTITKYSSSSSNAYTIQGVAKNYITAIGRKSATLDTSKGYVRMAYNSNGYWDIYDTSYRTYYLNQYGGASSTMAAGYTANGASDDGSQWQIYQVTPGTKATTTITFNGVSKGTTTVTIGNVTYKIHVVAEDLSNVTPLTIEYWITNSRLTGSDGNQALTIQAADKNVATEAGVNTADLVAKTGNKDGRTQEYWQTKILDVEKKNNSTSGTELQVTKRGDDETLNGKAFTKVRYWGGAWQVYTTEWVNVDRTAASGVEYTDDESNTQTYTGDKNQLVAYYMEVVDIKNSNGTTNLHVNAADWGTKGDGTGNWGYTPESSRCSVSVQLVYEDSSTNPADTTADSMKSKTIVYGYWDGGRGLGTMIFNGEDNYQIIKVTAETGTMASSAGNSSNTVTVTNFNWANNEETVWEGAATDSVSIGNPARNPSYDAPYDNLAWNTTDHNNNNAILIRVYVKAIPKSGALTVNYFAEGSTEPFYHYGINVEEKTVFDTGFARVTDKDAPGGAKLINNTVKNYAGETQTIQSDLSKMTEIGAQYRYSNYTFTKAERSTDGKTVNLYYTFNWNKAFVVDFGLPVVIRPNDVNENLKNATLTAAEITQSTTYANISVDNDKNITYTLKQTIDGEDNFSVRYMGNITTDTGTQTGHVDYSIKVIPATSVYYEDSFATFNPGAGAAADAKWSIDKDGTAAKAETNQALSALGAQDIYGYDEAYKDSTKLSMGSAHKVTVSADMAKTWTPTSQWPTATFTFKGTGFDVISLTNSDSGTVVYTVTNKSTGASESHIINNYYGYRYDENTGKWVVANNDSTAPYQVPVIKVSGLDYDTYEVTISVIYGALFDNTGDHQYSFWLDAIRVYDPAGATLNTEYAKDNENAPYYVRIKQVILDSKALETDGATGAVFIDGKGANGVTATDYANQGPNHEAYLANGQAIAFQMIASAKPTSVQIGAKLASGNSAGLKIGGAACAKANNGTLTLNTATDMYYELTDMGWTQSDGVYKSSVITLTNAGSGIISLTNLKFIGAKYTNSLPEVKSATSETNLVTLAVSSEMIDEALTTVDGVLNPAPETFEPSHFEADWNRSVRAGQKATLTVKTSEDVDAITVDGQTITTYRTRTERTGWGWWSPRVTYRVFTYTTTAQATADYEVCALNSSGVASEPITATLTVKPAINWWHKWF